MELVTPDWIYCTIGDDSDVHVARTYGTVLTCQCVQGGVHTASAAKMLAHLTRHRADDQKVPQEAIDRLTEEAGYAAMAADPEYRREQQQIRLAREARRRQHPERE